jgi:hypothetical protein
MPETPASTLTERRGGFLRGRCFAAIVPVFVLRSSFNKKARVSNRDSGFHE